MNKLTKHIETKQNELLNIAKQLKNDFVGLDSIIDQIMESIRIWYIFPELQIRPTIVCLWGLTGVGKTDLVRKMVSYMHIQDRFLEIEMNGINEPSLTIQKRLDESSIAADDHCILFLDEFQKFRTVDEHGNTAGDNSAYADVWTLLSDGKFHSDLSKKTELIEELLYAKYWGDMNRVENENNTSKKEEKKKKSKVLRVYHTPVYLARKVKRLFKLSETIEEIMKWDDEKIFQLYESFSRNPQIYEGETFKKMLIVISGNLDEAYFMAKDVEESDLDADYYHEISKRLTVLDIKLALEKRFRPEQIARFGNTHILYPALSRSNYKKIIEIKCQQINDLVLESKGITITYDSSVYDTIYNNGVFPTQGVRPLLSTITNILSAALPSYIFECLVNDVKSISISSNQNKMIGIIGGKSIEIEIPTVLDNLRKKTDEDTKNVVAVHELGHAIAYAILFNVCPKQICVDSVHPYNNGFVLQHSLREHKVSVLKTIQICLAGRVAEEIVFGTGMASTGAVRDIEVATQMAWSYVARWGYDVYVGYFTQKDTDNDFEIYSRERIGEVAESLLKDAKKMITDVLHKNLHMYRLMLEFLIKNGKISRIEFIEFAKMFGIELKNISDGEKLQVDYASLTQRFLNQSNPLDK